MDLLATDLVNGFFSETGLGHGCRFQHVLGEDQVAEQAS